MAFWTLAYYGLNYGDILCLNVVEFSFHWYF